MAKKKEGTDGVSVRLRCVPSAVRQTREFFFSKRKLQETIKNILCPKLLCRRSSYFLANSTCPVVPSVYCPTWVCTVDVSLPDTHECYHWTVPFQTHTNYQCPPFSVLIKRGFFQPRKIITYRHVIKTLEQFKYLGMTLMNWDSIQKETKSRLKSGNACYHSVQNFCLPVCYPKI